MPARKGRRTDKKRRNYQRWIRKANREMNRRESKDRRNNKRENNKMDRRNKEMRMRYLNSTVMKWSNLRLRTIWTKKEEML
jgi:hypothetical protein